MTNSELYNTQNNAAHRLESRIEALEAAIRVLVRKLPPGHYAVAKKELNTIGITVTRSN